MASLATITANRLNSQNSTGPRTAAPVPVAPLPLTTTQAEMAHAPTRQAASSRNPVRHNLSPGATFTLLPGEDVAAFEKLVRDYRDEFKPRTAHEVFLVNQMIQAQWRIGRIERLQAEVLDVILNVPAAGGKSDEAAIIASLGFAHGQTLDRLERCGRAAERAYFRANKELKQYRAEKQNEAKSTARPVPVHAKTTENAPGFSCCGGKCSASPLAAPQSEPARRSEDLGNPALRL